MDAALWTTGCCCVRNESSVRRPARLDAAHYAVPAPGKQIRVVDGAAQLKCNAAIVRCPGRPRCSLEVHPPLLLGTNVHHQNVLWRASWRLVSEEGAGRRPGKRLRRVETTIVRAVRVD